MVWDWFTIGLILLPRLMVSRMKEFFYSNVILNFGVPRYKKDMKRLTITQKFDNQHFLNCMTTFDIMACLPLGAVAIQFTSWFIGVRWAFQVLIGSD